MKDLDLSFYTRSLQEWYILQNSGLDVLRHGPRILLINSETCMLIPCLKSGSKSLQQQLAFCGTRRTMSFFLEIWKIKILQFGSEFISENVSLNPDFMLRHNKLNDPVGPSENHIQALKIWCATIQVVFSAPMNAV